PAAGGIVSLPCTVRGLVGALLPGYADAGWIAPRPGRPPTGHVAGLVDHLCDRDERGDPDLCAQVEVRRHDHIGNVLLGVFAVVAAQDIAHTLLGRRSPRGEDRSIGGYRGRGSGQACPAALAYLDVIVLGDRCAWALRLVVVAMRGDGAGAR